VWLVVGLGNPGREYEDTRHNVGFKVVEALADRADAGIFQKKFRARTARATIGGQDVWLLKPETFMNLSGESVGPATGFFKIPTSNVIVVHDDMDIELGSVKLKQGGGHGGHNGLRSLKAHLPDDGFLRVRVGVSRPPPQWDPADWVLSPFHREEEEALGRALKEAAGAVSTILRQGMAKAMNRYNRTPKKRAKKPGDETQAAPPNDGAVEDNEAKAERDTKS
jgi:PTH1 family peptidyl-tRNA hydrolase